MQYNLQQHFDIKHGAKYANLSHQEKQQKLQEFKFSPHTQQNVCKSYSKKLCNSESQLYCAWRNCPILKVVFWRYVSMCALTRNRVLTMSAYQETLSQISGKSTDTAGWRSTWFSGIFISCWQKHWQYGYGAASNVFKEAWTQTCLSVRSSWMWSPCMGRRRGGTSSMQDGKVHK